MADCFLPKESRCQKAMRPPEEEESSPRLGFRLHAWLSDYEKMLDQEDTLSTAVPSEVNSLSARSSQVSWSPSNEGLSVFRLRAWSPECDARLEGEKVWSSAEPSDVNTSCLRSMESSMSDSSSSSRSVPELEEQCVHTNSKEHIVEAARCGLLDEVRAYLLAGIPPHSRDASGWAPLHYAAAEGHLDVCALLLEANRRDVCIAAPDHSTPLMLAVEEGHLNVAQLLLSYLESELQLRHKDENGFSALDRCAEKIREEFEVMLTQF